MKRTRSNRQEGKEVLPESTSIVSSIIMPPSPPLQGMVEQLRIKDELLKKKIDIQNGTLRKSLLLFFFVLSSVQAQVPANCSSYLVSSQSTPSSSCPSLGNVHYWPVGDVTVCHGWAAKDSSGKTHLNSAKNIRCAPDGLSFLYDQYAGNLDCSGTGKAKHYSFTCTQGFPPSLYDKAVDLSCCGAQGFNTIGCKFGSPTVVSTATTGNYETRNGVRCDYGESSSASGTVIPSMVLNLMVPLLSFFIMHTRI